MDIHRTIMSFSLVLGGVFLVIHAVGLVSGDGGLVPRCLLERIFV